MHGLLKATLAAALLAAPAAATAASFVVMGAAGADLDAAVAKAGGTVAKRLTAIDAVVADGGDNFKNAVARQAGVDSVVPNIRVEALPDIKAEAIADAATLPADPVGSTDSYFPLQWGHSAVKAVAAWNAGYKGQGARVAILDSGFSPMHQDIAGQFDPDCVQDFTGEGVDYTFGAAAHGMHVAGIVAAAANDIGTIGVAPESTLCLVKVLRADGSSDLAQIAEGIVFAANRNVDIVNLSFGFWIDKSGIKGVYTAREAGELRHLIDRAVSYAYKRGALVIASAGNDGVKAKDASLIHLPSTSPQVISVAATAPVGWFNNPGTSLDVPASYTNFGIQGVDLAAPGGDQWSSVTGTCSFPAVGRPRGCAAFDLVFSTGAVTPAGGNTYYWHRGTSVAAAYASGVAALIVSKYGHMHPAQLRAYLNGGADDLGALGKDPVYGVGRVNALSSISR
jgi:lantibiotic leader peptide-processing serine protease